MYMLTFSTLKRKGNLGGKKNEEKKTGKEIEKPVQSSLHIWSLGKKHKRAHPHEHVLMVKVFYRLFWL